MPPKSSSARRRWLWAAVLGALLVAAAWWRAPIPSRSEPPAIQVRKYLETENWAAILTSLATDPLTNALERLAVVRALFEAGLLPEDLFSCVHQPGPDLLSATALRKQLGTAYAAAIALELGQVNVAERWAFDSLEMEGESPTALRVLAELHVIKGLPQAARIFLNRLELQPEHRPWARGLQVQLATNPTATEDPDLSRIRSNLVERDALVTRLSTEAILQQAYAAHPENRMAFEFLMAHQLLTRRVTDALQTLASSPQGQEGPLPRHYAEAVVLLDHLRPGTSPAQLRQRVPTAVVTRFQGFQELMNRTGAVPQQQIEPQAWADFGDTYWYYHFFGPDHQPHPNAPSRMPEPEFSPRQEPPREALTPASAPESGRLPRIAPDYVDVVIPPNLAPLNLMIQEPGTEYQLRLAGPRGSAIELRQPSPHIRFPLDEWKQVLEANRGEALRWDIAIRNLEGGWISCAPFTNRVAEEAIDSHLVYRRLQPLFSYYKNLGIYQRNLETFEEKPVLRNTEFNHGCLNCHTFAQGAPDRFVIALRTPSGTPTLLVQSNRVTRLEQKIGYPSWHPNGRLIACSVNTISQYFHTAGPVNRDIYDPRSDLALYHLDSGVMEKPPVIARSDRSENWPSWSPDGRYLYYCRAPGLAIRHQQDFRYDLLRVPYDPDQNQWGEPEILFSAAEQRRSAHQPRVSPDGQLLLFTVSDSGSFPVFRADSDLYLLHLDTREIQPLPINSDVADTWHCWSTSGRWLVFGSKRLDGVFTRVFITQVDSDSRFSKPLLLPQEDPAFYETCLDNFNLPELVRGPVQVSEADLAQAVNTRDGQRIPDAETTTASDDDDYHP